MFKIPLSFEKKNVYVTLPLKRLEITAPFRLEVEYGVSLSRKGLKVRFLPYHPCCRINTNRMRTLPLKMNMGMFFIAISAATLKKEKCHRETMIKEIA